MIIQHIKLTCLSYLKVITVLTLFLPFAACRTGGVVQFVPVSANKAKKEFGYIDPSHCVLEEFTGDAEITDYLRSRILDALNKRFAVSRPPGAPESAYNDDWFMLRCEIITSGPITLQDKHFSENPVQVSFDRLTMGSSTSTGMHIFHLPLSNSASDTLQTQLDEVVYALLDLFLPLPPETVETELAVGKSKYDKQGRGAAVKGEFQEALHCFLKAIDAHPTDHAALYNAGVMHEALGAPSKAKTFYQRAKKLNSNLLYEQALARK